MIDLAVQRHDVHDLVEDDYKLAHQLWVGAARGLEMHFVVIGAGGAVCFRTGGGHADAVRFHWREEGMSKGSKHLDECPVLGGEPCWSDKLDEGIVQNAAGAFLGGADELWRYLEAIYQHQISL